jgi:GDPmannose 4,6-dehydratase
MILQAEEAEDWVIATGKTTSVRDFVRMAFGYCGMELAFKGTGIEEKGVILSVDEERFRERTRSELDPMELIGKEVVAVDPRYFRPTEVDLLIGDPTKAKEKLGWEPEYTLEELVEEMMASDLKLMKRDEYLKAGGYTIMNYFE